MRNFTFSFTISESLLDYHKDTGVKSDTVASPLEILLMNRALSQCFGTLLFSATESSSSANSPTNKQEESSVHCDSSPHKPSEPESADFLRKPIKRKTPPTKLTNDAPKRMSSPIKPTMTMTNLVDDLNSAALGVYTTADVPLQAFNGLVSNHQAAAWMNAYASWYASALPPAAATAFQPAQLVTPQPERASPTSSISTCTSSSVSPGNNLQGTDIQQSQQQKAPKQKPIPRITVEERITRTCSLCGKAFRHLTNLGRHKRKIHTDGRPAPQPVMKRPDILSPRERQTLECSVCDARFTVLSNLRRHKRSAHNNGCLFVCHLCNKMFSRPDNLKTHVCIAGSGEQVKEEQLVNYLESQLHPGDIQQSQVSTAVEVTLLKQAQQKALWEANTPVCPPLIIQEDDEIMDLSSPKKVASPVNEQVHNPLQKIIDAIKREKVEELAPTPPPMCDPSKDCLPNPGFPLGKDTLVVEAKMPPTVD